jgi:hypothetical protein
MFVTYEVERVAPWLSHVDISAEHSIVLLKFVILQDRPIAVVTINSATIKGYIVGKLIIEDAHCLFKRRAYIDSRTIV